VFSATPSRVSTKIHKHVDASGARQELLALGAAPSAPLNIYMFFAVAEYLELDLKTKQDVLEECFSADQAGRYFDIMNSMTVGA